MVLYTLSGQKKLCMWAKAPATAFSCATYTVQAQQMKLLYGEGCDGFWFRPFYSFDNNLKNNYTKSYVLACTIAAGRDR